jgi:membrane protein implicated in regulation of membrane protease activity
MNLVPAIFGPSLVGLLILTLGGCWARSKNAYRSWGVVAGAIILIQGFFLLGFSLFFGIGAAGSLVVSVARNPWLCAGFALWLASLIARAVYFARGRKRFDDPKDDDAA